MLIQRELGENRANWVTTLQEYDLEIKPIKILRGRGFCRLINGAFDNSTKEHSGNNFQVSKVCPVGTESQFDDLIFYLKMVMHQLNSITREK